MLSKCQRYHSDNRHGFIIELVFSPCPGETLGRPNPCSDGRMCTVLWLESRMAETRDMFQPRRPAGLLPCGSASSGFVELPHGCNKWNDGPDGGARCHNWPVSERCKYCVRPKRPDQFQLDRRALRGVCNSKTFVHLKVYFAFRFSPHIRAGLFCLCLSFNTMHTQINFVIYRQSHSSINQICKNMFIGSNHLGAHVLATAVALGGRIFAGKQWYVSASGGLGKNMYDRACISGICSTARLPRFQRQRLLLSC